jgi:hypothetical protein
MLQIFRELLTSWRCLGTLDFAVLRGCEHDEHNRRSRVGGRCQYKMG